MAHGLLTTLVDRAPTGVNYVRESKGVETGRGGGIDCRVYNWRLR